MSTKKVSPISASTSDILSNVREAMTESEHREQMFSMLKNITVRLDHIETNQIALLKLNNRVAHIENNVGALNGQVVDLQISNTTTRDNMLKIQENVSQNTSDIRSIEQSGTPHSFR